MSQKENNSHCAPQRQSMNETVSVIVPVYNAQSFLKKCIISILEQTYSDLQLILIDDGSSDNSLKICYRFAEKDNRVLVLSQNNKGVSSARNNGLEYIRGKYVTFVDADDWLPRDGIQKLYEGMNKLHAQFIVGAMYRLFPINSSKENIENLEINRGKPNISNIKKFYSYMGYYAHVAKKLLLSEIIKKNALIFPEKIKCGEDTCFMLDYLSHCDIIVSTNEVVYYNTRLYDNTGGTKYYPERHIWAEDVLRKYKNTVERFLSSENSRNIISKEAIYNINKISKRHIENNNSIEKRRLLVHNTYTILEPYISKDYIPDIGDEKAFQEYKELREKIDSFNYAKKNETNSQIFKTYIKSIISYFKYLLIFKIFIKSKI